MDEPDAPRRQADEEPLDRALDAGEGWPDVDGQVDDGPDGEDDGAASIDSLGLPMPVLPVDTALDLLRTGELSVVGQLWASSNNALLCLATKRCPDPEPDLVAACIYKPVMGERPLDDFPDGTLARREVAAFVASQATPWNIVPPTVLRDGPFGEGMVQLWIRTDAAVDPVELVVNGDERLRRIAVFDAAVNNTDRKAGHLLPVTGRPHLRRGPRRDVLAGAEAQDGALGLARRPVLGRGDRRSCGRCTRHSAASLGDELRGLLDPIEVRATARRIGYLLEAGTFPHPDPRRPALPWPPV